MPSHKFHIGDSVMLKPAISRNVPGGVYEVIKQLPHNGREYECTRAWRSIAVEETRHGNAPSTVPSTRREGTDEPGTLAAEVTSMALVKMLRCHAGSRCS